MLLISAKWIAILMGDANLAPMLRAASFSYLFVGVLGVLRGYYQAQHEMNIPAMSQVIEQVVRVGIIMIAVLLYLLQHWSIYISALRFTTLKGLFCIKNKLDARKPAAEPAIANMPD